MSDEATTRKTRRASGPADPEKRETLRKLAVGAAFAAPVVVSFSLNGLAVTNARAYVDTSNGVAPLPAYETSTGGTDRGGQSAGSSNPRPGAEFNTR